MVNKSHYLAGVTPSNRISPCRLMKTCTRNVRSASTPTAAWIWTTFWTCPSEFESRFQLPDRRKLIVPSLSLYSSDQLGDLMHSRVRRRFARGMQRKSVVLVKKLRKAKKEAPPLEKPEIVKTHMRSMIVVPEMIGSIVGVYNGKTFNQVRVVLSCFWQRLL